MNRYAKTFAVGAAGLAGAIAIGVGSAGASTMYPPCAAGQMPTPQAPCIPAGMTMPEATAGLAGLAATAAWAAPCLRA